jgi:hypothetical protein
MHDEKREDVGKKFVQINSHYDLETEDALKEACQQLGLGSPAEFQKMMVRIGLRTLKEAGAAGLLKISLGNI